MQKAAAELFRTAREHGEAFPAFPPVPPWEQGGETWTESEVWKEATRAVMQARPGSSEDRAAAAEAVRSLHEACMTAAVRRGGKVMGVKTPGSEATAGAARALAGGAVEEALKEARAGGGQSGDPKWLEATFGCEPPQATEEGGWLDPNTGHKLRGEAWERRGATGLLLRDVKDGVDWVWSEGRPPPVQLDKPNLKSVQLYKSWVMEEIGRYEAQGLMQWQDEVLPGADPMTPDTRFVKVINPWGACEKPDFATTGAVRPYLDMSASGVNERLAGWPMELPTAESVMGLLRRGYYLGKRDLKHGFQHMKLTAEASEYVGFRCPDTGRVGRLCVLPFGASQSPARFWIMSNEVLRMLRAELLDMEAAAAERGQPYPPGEGPGDVILAGYIDDYLFGAPTWELVQLAFEVADRLGGELGLTFKAAKDEGRSDALQAISFVGLELDCREDPVMRVPAAKQDKFGAAVDELLAAEKAQGEVDRRALQKTVGMLAFAARACRWGRTFLGHLYDNINAAAVKVPLTPGARQDLEWWAEALKPGAFWGTRSYWGMAQWDLIKGTHYMEQGGDAAGEPGLGWGASTGYEKAAGLFTEEEQSLHISWKELRAILHGLQLWGAEYAGRRVVVWSDNTAACAAVNTGRVRARQEHDRAMARAMVREIARICARNGVDLRARHIPGPLNEVNDALSRGRRTPSSADYKLMPQHYERVMGGEAAEVDMYAAVDARNCQRLTDRGRGTRHGSVQRPAHTLGPELPGRRLWANPPWDLAGEALQLVAEAWMAAPWTTSGVVAVPAWDSQWWYRRWILRHNSPYKVLERIPAGTRPFLATGSDRFRKNPERAPPAAGPLRWDLLLLGIGAVRERGGRGAQGPGESADDHPPPVRAQEPCGA